MRTALYVGGFVLVIIIVLVAFVFWASSMRPYSSSDLSNVSITKTDKSFSIHFQTPAKSFYYPVLIDYHQNGNQIEVTIYKQLKLSPMKGITYTNPPSQVLLNFIHPKEVIDERVFTFGLSNPDFVLKTFDGETPIPLK